MIRYVCPACARRFGVTPDRFRCECGSPLDLDFSAEKIDVDALGRRPASLWRWHEALPLVGPLPTTSLGAGLCPVVEDRIHDIPVHLVLDFASPTGSYKDRGASLITAIAVALGVEEVFDDSSGNAAIALAAHAARRGLRARVLVPSDAPRSKPALARRLGADVVRVEGGRAAASAAALREARTGSFYASHAWNPFFLHGTKTLAYAMAESLRWTVPSAVLVPCGNGGLVLGLDLGFREMRRHGLIDRRPALIAVQAEACAPLHRAFVGGLEEPVPLAEGSTVADGIRVGSPPRGGAVLRTVRESGGSVESVSEEEIEAAHASLWTKGYAVEPTAAVAPALVRRVGPELRARYGDVAVVLTGSGLKTDDGVAAT